MIGGTYTPTVTSTSGLPVTLSLSPEDDNACKLVAGSSPQQFDLFKAGGCFIQADQSGDAQWAPAERVVQLINVGKKPQEITFAKPDDVEFVSGGTVELNATSTGAEGDINFTSQDTGVCTVEGSTVTMVVAGMCRLYADKAGDVEHFDAETVYQSFTLFLINQPPVADAGANQTVASGANVTLAGSGADADGTIDSYMWGRPPRGTTLTGENSASPTFIAPTLAAGAADAVLIFSLRVIDNLGQASPAAFVSITVKAPPKPQTITFDANAPTSLNVGATYTPTATSTSRLRVTFEVSPLSSNGACAFQNGSTTLTMTGPGNCTIQAIQTGNEEWALAAYFAHNILVTAANARPVATINKTLGLPIADSGAELTLFGSGTDADGTIASYAWTATNGATLANANSATATLTAPILEAGSDPMEVIVSLIVTDNLGLASVADTYTITVYAPEAVNTAPSAYAGEDQTVASGAAVILDGSYSNDLDSDDITYQWTQTAGAEVELNTQSPSAPSFTAPVLALGDLDVSLTFKLIVNDGDEDSEPAFVTITVKAPEPANIAPTANAGTAQTVVSGALVTLAGSGTDADGKVTGYFWKVPVGVTLSNEKSQSPSFTAPILATGAADLVLRISLQTFDDRDGTSEPATVTITVKAPANIAPTANAGQPQTMASGATVTLGGSGTDADGSVKGYAWTAPDGITLTNANSASASFTTPTLVAGAADVVLTFSLVVTDNLGLASPAASVTITVKAPAPANKAPVADAGQPQTVASGATVTLSGSGRDDGTIASYAWTAPNGTALTGGTTTTPSFTAPTLVAGAADIVLTFSLVVTDDLGLASEPASVTVTVKAPANSPPTAVTNVPNMATLGQTTILIGDQSLDPDGKHTLSYNWKIYNRLGDVIFESSDANASFTPQNIEARNYTFLFTVTDHLGLRSAKTGNIYVRAAPVNTAPVANAGPNQTVASNASVTLSGSGTDADGTIASYAWAAPGGIPLTDASAANPSFTAPTLAAGAADAVLTLSFVVTDNLGLASPAASVTVTVKAPAAVNIAPTANAGQPQTVASGATVILAGSGTDADGTIASYAWAAPSGTTLTGGNTGQPSFTAPTLAAGAADAVLTFSLVVTDNLGLASPAASVTITVKAPAAPINTAPVANAGTAQTVASGATVTLDASGSTDVESSALSYAWVSNNGIILSDAAAQKPTFVAPVVEVGSPNLTLSFEVTVSDGSGLQSKATSSVTVTANPGSVALQVVQEKVADKVSEVSAAVTMASTSDAIDEAFEDNSSGDDSSSVSQYTDGVRVDLSGRFASPSARAIDELALKGRVGMRERAGGSIPGLFAYDGSGSAAADAVDPKRWSVWGSARVSQLVTSASSNDLGGNQYNFNGGATYRINPNLVVGALGGYETFRYSDSIGSKFSGSGYTGGIYAGWRPDGGLRFDGQVSATRLGYDVQSGVVTGSYSGTRVQASVGVTGSMTAASVLFEPSLRATGTWEQQAAYRDSLGTAFASKLSSSGSVSAGLKASKRFVIDEDTSITPYASVLANYRFTEDAASAAASATRDFSARVGLGFNANLNSSTTLGLDGSLSGLGLEDTKIWSLKMKLGVAF